MYSRMRRLAVGAVTTAVGSLTLTAGLALMSSPSASADDPAGSNGTIKIVGHGEIDSVPDNNPHQGCTLGVEWYDFDEGDLTSTVTFQLWAPTRGDLAVDGDRTVSVGGDAAGGGTDLDGREFYTLHPAGVPNAQQGFHVRITVSTPGGKRTETKSKVIWVQGCDPSTPTPAPATSTPTTTGTPEPTTAPTPEPTTAPTPTAPGGVVPTTTPTTPDGVVTSGVQVPRAGQVPVPTTIEAGLVSAQDEAGTPAGAGRALALAGAALVLGGGLLAGGTARRRGARVG